MNNESAAPPRVAPYLPFKTFLGAVETLEQGIPRKIDKSIWRTASGLNQGLIMGAFRFFNLVDQEDKPTQWLSSVVEKKEHRKEALRQLLEKNYSELLSHDLTKMTPKHLEEEIEKYGVTGATKQKAITFFLQAAKAADMSLSPFLQKQVRASAPRKRRTTVRKDDEGGLGDNGTPPEDTVTTSGSKKVIHLKSAGTIALTISADVFTLSPEDRKFVFELIDKLQGYEKAANGQ